MFSRSPISADPFDLPLVLAAVATNMHSRFTSRGWDDLICSDNEWSMASVEGCYAPEEHQDTGEGTMSLHFEETALVGDTDKLSAQQIQAVLRLKESSIYPRIKLKQVNLSFSGASVLFYSPMRNDGTPMPSSVLKLDTAENVREEVEKTNLYAPLFGITTPKVKDTKYPEGADPNEPCAIMQIDLCGGLFGLPEFASAPPVDTFASVIQAELVKNSLKVELVPLVREALERRLYSFTMSSRTVKSVNLASMYKLVRFVGHGVLNRAKEGAKRAAKSPALAAGFLNPPAVDDLDPEGHMLQELSGMRKTIKEFFEWFVSFEATFAARFTQNVVVGLCHNDMHGGNLLLDSQGLVWLIDFATVSDDMHVLIDLVKFAASCLFLYLGDNISEENVHYLAKLIATTPNSIATLPTSFAASHKDPTATILFDIIRTLRQCAIKYEMPQADEQTANDGMPFVLAFFSWSARMLSYTEPNKHQKARAVFCAMAMAQRVLKEAGTDIGPTATNWLKESAALWSASATSDMGPGQLFVQTAFDLEQELPRFLAQVGTAEAWTTDFITREKVHVTDHCIPVTVKFSQKVFPRTTRMHQRLKFMMQVVQDVFQDYLPHVLQLERYYGRLLVVGDPGTGKTMLTRQFFSEIAQRQLVKLRRARDDDGTGSLSAAQMSDLHNIIVPLRVPLIDLARLLEADPGISLESNPMSDVLARWVQRKYGKDSAPAKLIQSRRTGHPDVSNPASESTKTGLFLLLDALDEASSLKTSLLQYVGALLRSEPLHLVVVTSRPGAVGQQELDTFASLGFSSCTMSILSPSQGAEIVAGAMRRLKDSPESINALLENMRNPAYRTLTENPLTLTLLTHVLRKHLKKKRSCAAMAGADGETQLSQAVLKRTEVYQRSIKLMLHQSDAAKYAMRDGENDRLMVQRLEILKSTRARKLFQAVSWHAHSRNSRALTWDGIAASSHDEEMLSAFRGAFEEGRLTIFEPLVLATQEPLVQMVHLSFQELMAGEFIAAVMQYAQTAGKTAPYINTFLSKSSSHPERERLSEHWWLQVWFHLCECLEPGAFDEWCHTLAQDERAHLKVGTMFRINNPTKAHQPPFYETGVPVVVTEVDWETHQISLEEPVGCCAKRELPGLEQWKLPFSLVQWYGDGVCTIFRAAAAIPSPRLVRRLLDMKVHYACCGENGLTALHLAIDARQWIIVQLLADEKLEHPSIKTTGHPCMAKEVMDILGLYGPADEMINSKCYGALEEAKEGTLTLSGQDDLNVNFSDPDSLLTPLMYAAATGNVDLVAHLLGRKASVAARSYQGSSALTFATECDNGSGGVACMRLLIAARSDLSVRSTKYGCQYRNKLFFHSNAGGFDEPLGFQAVVRGHVEKVDVLLAGGLDLNAANHRGFTLMWRAVIGFHGVLIRKLFDAKAGLWSSSVTCDKRVANTIPKWLHSDTLALERGRAANPTCGWAYSRPDEQTAEALDILFELGMDASHALRFKLPLLPVYCYYPVFLLLALRLEVDQLPLLQKFLDHGFDLNMKCGPSLGIAGFLLFETSPGLLRWLLDNGLDPSRGVPGGSLEKLAKRRGNKAALDVYNDWLLEQDTEM